MESEHSARLQVTVRQATREEIPAVARIHYYALPDDYLPSLGLDFLERVHYPAAFASEHGINLVAVVGGQPVGFVTVAHDAGNFSRDVMRRGVLKMAWYAVRAALRFRIRPTLILICLISACPAMVMMCRRCSLAKS